MGKGLETEDSTHNYRALILNPWRPHACTMGTDFLDTLESDSLGNVSRERDQKICTEIRHRIKAIV